MYENKVIKNIIMGLGLILLLAGQILIFTGTGAILGGALTLLCVIFFTLAITDKYTLITAFFVKISGAMAAARAEKIKREQAPAAVAPVRKTTGAKLSSTKQTSPEIIEIAQRENRLIALIKNMIANKNSFDVRFSIPKWVIFSVVVLIFGAAQYLFLKDNMKLAVMLLVFDGLILLATFLMKTPALDVDFKIDSGLKILSLISGLALCIAGWFLLINQNIAIQEWGVVLSVPGAILVFLGLPRSDASVIQETDRSDILFLKPDFLNNYIVKGIFIIAAFIVLNIGMKVMQSPDYNMYSMVFYAAAGCLLFFAFPVFNFAEKQYDSKILDYVKLFAVIAAVALAYHGQKLFIANDINKAVIYYVIAALIFISAFPVYSSKEHEEKEHFPLKVEVIFLILITAVGAFLRFYEIDVRPFGIENDEAGGLTARMSRNGETTLNLTVGNFGIYAHIVRVFIAIFGGMNRIDIKFMPIIVGIIAIPVVYFLIRDLFNARAAMFVVVIFTFLRWNVYYSRYTSPVIMSICTEAIALYFFFKAIETRKKFAWFMAGLCIGITWHGPMTFFLLIVPFAFYFIITALSKKGYFRANLVGILAFTCGLWIFGSMILHNYFISQRIYFGRVAEVSVFSKDPNAPSKNVAKGIVENTKQVLLMFNHMGDSRQRNSGGMPLESTVDFLTSLLFAIGFLYALYYSKYYQFFIMVMVFFSQAAGSIFSIEAPSAMRAVGTMVPLIFFIALTFDRIWMAFRRALGKKFEIIYVPLIMLIFLIPIAKENYYQYFQRWISGLDELSTAAGMYSAKLGDKTRIVLYTSLYYPGHPPYKFFRWDYKVNSADRFTTGLVHLREVTDENFAIFFHYDTWENIESIKRTMFPDSKITIVDHKLFNKNLKPGEGFGTLIKAMEISNAEIQKSRGLTGVYSFGGNPGPNEAVEFRAEDAGQAPYSVTWKGLVLIPYYGSYRLFNSGTAKIGVSIDGHSISTAGEELLAEGFHKITVTAYRNSAADTLNFSMQAKMLDGNNITKVEMIQVDKKYLYNFPSFGLHGYFYKGAEWSGNPIRYEVINTNMCFGGGGILTESAEWKGILKVPAADNYIISAHSNGYVRVIMDGRYYSDQGSGNSAIDEKVEKYFAARKLVKAPAGFNLSAGRHAIEIYCMNTSLLDLMWSSRAIKDPGPIPVDALEPDYQISVK